MKLPNGMYVKHINKKDHIIVDKVDGLKINVVLSSRFKLRVKIACWCFRLAAWIMDASVEIENV